MKDGRETVIEYMATILQMDDKMIRNECNDDGIYFE